MDNKNNSGYNNSGYRNSGNYNSGDNNSGDFNSGYRNSGYRNSGYFNSGDNNSGDNNSGDYNSGDYNSGDRNSGNFNSGNRNSGNYNSGNFNSGYRNSGIFNTDEPKMRAFGKETYMTFSEWRDSDDYIYFNIPLNIYVFYSDMTDEEKKEHDYAKSTGGYLKTLDYEEAWAKWWEDNKSEAMKNKIKKLPNFDSSIFEEITGIKIDMEEKVEISMDEIAEKFGVDVKSLKIKK